MIEELRSGITGQMAEEMIMGAEAQLAEQAQE